ncbi:MAG TPA: M20/M25/M40 family metallo-hydrolase [Pyrinomonadaceae bacterium]|nr:M20/M25/M40 family metallo-hydrolase [Pyrinomonadaceae bacterium]
MKRLISLSVIFLMIFNALVRAQDEPVDHQVISRIKMEGFQTSKIMETVSYLTDVYGPRLTGSPNLKAAGEWSRKRLAEWGLANAQLEAWGAFGPGWSLKKHSVEMIAPQYMNIIAYPKAWTPSTKGTISGQPVIVDIKSKADFDKYRGKLRGAIVMDGRPARPNPHFEADARRLSERELLLRSQAINPGPPKSYAEVLQERRKYRAELDEIAQFFYGEGIAVLLEPSERDHGVVRVTRQSYNLNVDQSFPALVLAREHYGRIVRLLDKNIPVQLEINVQAQTHKEDTNGYNVVAEIPGTDPKLKDEVVMLGGHLDSWHGGTGATDNAAGCAVMMEAVRILKAIGIRPRRTIRLALWGGEEQGHLGSIGYMKKHFGDPESGQLLPGQEKLSAYFNLDNGTGRIRGVYLQGNEAVRPIFEAYLKPFNYLGATTLTAENTTGTDHQSFDAVGAPGFQFIQDSIEYGTRTHHTNMDVYEALLEDDLKQAAVIVASFVYHTAMRNERLPRKPSTPAR